MNILSFHVKTGIKNAEYLEDKRNMLIFATEKERQRAVSPSYDNSTRCAYHQNCRRVIFLNDLHASRRFKMPDIA